MHATNRRFILLLAGFALAGAAFGADPVTRIGSITGLKPEKAEAYRKLHASPWPEVLRRLERSHFRNYSIYQAELEGQLFLFSFLEYRGRNLAADSARMAADKATQRWWKETDPCQLPLPRAAKKGRIWDDMEEVYYFDGAIDVNPAAPVRRCAAVTGLRPEKEAHYRTLHATPWPAVNAAIKDVNIRKFAIYLKDIGGKLYLFYYFEYVGSNFDADMGRMKDDPVTLRWWKETDPCQLPLPGAAAKNEIWTPLDEVFHAE